MIDQINITTVIPFCPEYTPEYMLNEAIDSVRRQTVQSKVIVVRDTEKKGAAWARNVGLKKATTKYVAFLDADDIWLHNKLDRQLNLISSTNAAMCIQGPRMKTDAFIRDRLLGVLYLVKPAVYSDINVAHTSSILVDQTMVNVEFKTDLPYYEDHLFMVEVAASGGVCCCENLIQVRKHNKGLTAEGTPSKVYEAQCKVAQVLKNSAKLYPYARKYRQVALFTRGRGHHIRGEYRESCLWYYRCLKYGPVPKVVVALGLALVSGGLQNVWQLIKSLVRNNL